MTDVTPFAYTNFRNEKRKFGIKEDDRRRHMYIVGKTGMGKSVLIENLVYSDIINGHGLCHVDPHGDSAELIVDCIPPERINDVIYFNPSDIDYPVAFNVLEKVEPKYRHLVASGLVGVFKKIWADSWGPRLEYLLRNTILALLDYPDSTLLGVNRMLVDTEYRRKVVQKIQDPVVKMFWTDEFTKYGQQFLTEAIAPIQNKVGQFLSTSLIRNIVGQVKSSINLRQIMDEGKILILNMSKGRIGEDAASLLGAMMITKIQLAAMSRVDIIEDDRKDFYLYVDEFQNFVTESFANILSEARKYHLCLTMGHQYVEQLGEVVKPAVFGNVGTIVTFRVGAEDAQFLVKEYSPTFEEEDLVNLPKYNIYLKLMIDGVASDPFSATTLPPISKITNSTDTIIKVSRERYSKKREIVEDKIVRWSGVETEAMLDKLEKKLNEEKLKKVIDRKGDFLSKMKGVEEEDEDDSIDEKLKEVAKKKTESASPEVLAKDPVDKPKWREQKDDSEEKKDEYLEVVKCDGCGIKTKINFKPNPNRPVYCKDCLKDYRRMQALQDNMKTKRQSAGMESKDQRVEKEFTDLKKSFDKPSRSTSRPPRRDTRPSRPSNSGSSGSADKSNSMSLDDLKKSKPTSFRGK
ncbi:type IV secretion system DNA-binding domain-containing protein [Candidatus Falkowbacteria bacterium]|jgi:CxxC-x17-CxxC domain-containing protein|nr:type IV secretion system DNA-binding domain-containing protein [Candidatus Falkowbacteria bacterium]MBT7007409.1 type IV secretion system DNA-binding domain-containing protein [Candidatus Falkowbacteria bacterium]